MPRFKTLEEFEALPLYERVYAFNLYLLNSTEYQPAQKTMMSCSFALDISGEAFMELLVELWKGWEEHPDFDWYYSDGSASASGKPPPLQPLNPICLGAFRHEVYQGHDESYVVDTPQGCLSPSTLKWGGRTLGEFVGLRPIYDEISVWPYGQVRQGYVSWSLKGAGKAYRARMELKKLLPRKLHTLISQARKGKRTPKWSYLKERMDGLEWAHRPKGIVRKPSLQPEWYRNASKADLWMGSIKAREPEKVAKLLQYMTLENFWLCATGEVHPGKVRDYVVHQKELNL